MDEVVALRQRVAQDGYSVLCAYLNREQVRAVRAALVGTSSGSSTGTVR